jgi:hypothetical protein
VNDAWDHVYRLLLWIDRTTGLAHCYESDKSQPGRHWYGRSLAFHDWVAAALGVAPSALAQEIDWLFKRATEDLAASVLRLKEGAATRAKKQRQPYEGRGLPEPGEDPALVALISDVLAPFFKEDPPEDAWRVLTGRIQAHLSQENKRKNLVGEGFEDTLREIIALVPAQVKLTPGTRVPIGEIRGFNAPGRREKNTPVDLVVINESTGYRRLVTAKWSIRADREGQFLSDFQTYTRLESDGEPFDYTVITNEFDAARLLAACEQRVANQYAFTDVVHVNPLGVLAVYGNDLQRSAETVAEYVKSGRLISLSNWLDKITTA